MIGSKERAPTTSGVANCSIILDRNFARDIIESEKKIKTNRIIGATMRGLASRIRSAINSKDVKLHQ